MVAVAAAGKFPASANGDAGLLEEEEEARLPGQLGRHLNLFGRGQLNPLGTGRPTLPSKYLKMQNHQKCDM